jgi:RNA polymerase sigma-70 factor (ECF subfamily)
VAVALEIPHRMPFNAGSDSRSDAELLAALRTGDRGAFETLFLRYHAPLCAFAYHYVEIEAVAEELVQDTFLFVWNQRSTWDVPYDAFRRYIFASVRNAALSHLRHRRIEDKTAGDVIALTTAPPLPDRETQNAELAAAIRVAVQRLPERCRDVFALHREQGMSYNEIADVLGIAPKTVEIHMGRAFKLLRKSLARFRGSNDLAR